MHMFLKAGNDVFPKTLPTHSFVSDNDVATSTKNLAYVWNFSTFVSNNNPSILEHSNETNVNNSRNDPFQSLEST